MTMEQVSAIFVLAEIPVKSFHKLANNYWPDNPEHEELRRNTPWWLAETDHGLIRIGWRKRVISIEWESTPVREQVTEDAVTKSDTAVHAYSYAKAVEYLSRWRQFANRQAAKEKV